MSRPHSSFLLLPFLTAVRLGEWLRGRLDRRGGHCGQSATLGRLTGGASLIGASAYDNQAGIGGVRSQGVAALWTGHLDSADARTGSQKHVLTHRVVYRAARFTRLHMEEVAANHLRR